MHADRGELAVTPFLLGSGKRVLDLGMWPFRRQRERCIEMQAGDHSVHVLEPV